ncbi:hypothetical protein COLO4_08621 [Corchorus olitorius]|uniref:Uncharacterized protein n=1 Tax=Corchorus olitorius TaxID=93759 RepID=A0A1R3KF53_9ROSI|nr:hypothetical protein COLO4_08621 [Corchorus olitorius]
MEVVDNLDNSFDVAIKKSKNSPPNSTKTFPFTRMMEVLDFAPSIASRFVYFTNVGVPP